MTYAVQVRRSLSGSRDGHPIFTTLKTAKSRRQVRLTAGATEALKRHRKRQLEERSSVAALWQDHGLVFTTKVGTPLNRHNDTYSHVVPGMRDHTVRGWRTLFADGLA